MANHQLERLGVVPKALALADVGQSCLDVGVANGVKVKALHARKNGLRDLLRVGGAENKDHMRRRLLKRLEQRVERCRGKHVNLVDDVHLVGTARGCKAHSANDLFAHVVDARTTCRVQLVDVGMLARGNVLALLAGAVGQVSRPLLA